MDNAPSFDPQGTASASSSGPPAIIHISGGWGQPALIAVPGCGVADLLHRCLRTTVLPGLGSHSGGRMQSRSSRPNQALGARIMEVRYQRAAEIVSQMLDVAMPGVRPLFHHP